MGNIHKITSKQWTYFVIGKWALKLFWEDFFVKCRFLGLSGYTEKSTAHFLLRPMSPNLIEIVVRATSTRWRTSQRKIAECERVIEISNRNSDKNNTQTPKKCRITNDLKFKHELSLLVYMLDTLCHERSCLFFQRTDGHLND